MTKLTILGTMFAATALLTTAWATSLENAGIHKTFQEQIDSRLHDANTACDTQITATTDWDSFDSIDLAKLGKKGLNELPIGDYCGRPLISVHDLCKQMKEDGKAAVKKSISKYVCRYGGEGKSAVDVSGGTLTFTVDFKDGNNDVDIRHKIAKKI